MQRTISAMMGKGSVAHNSRVFHAANTDPERSGLNRCYCNEDIRLVYQDLFGDALKRYNDKQKRNDRKILDYYEKIRSSEQEKLFFEIILQIGNCEDTNAKSEDGKLAVLVLDEYMQDFQTRNPNLRVFSAHLHMDEATPQLHIDFVPFTTGSKKGLDTRVSLKKALATQGFKGGTRQETEWNQWVASEKKQLATVMNRYDIFWFQKGTHEKHLSVLDYEKKVRAGEVTELETKIEDLQDTIQDKQETAAEMQAKLDSLHDREEAIEQNINRYDTDPEWQLSEPTKLMGASAYKTKIVEPFIKKLKSAIRHIVAQYLELFSKVGGLKWQLSQAQSSNGQLKAKLKEVQKDNVVLVEIAEDYKLVHNVLGEEQTENIVSKAKEVEHVLNKSETRHRISDRGR